MRKIVLPLLLLLFTASFAMSQDCEMYFPVNKGQVRELSSFDQKDKYTGKTRQTVIESIQSSDAFTLTILSEAMDQDDQILFNSELSVACKDGVFYMDMDDLLAGTANTMGDLDITIEGDNLGYPAGMKPGDRLMDGTITMTIAEAPMMNTTVRIFNRSVEAREDITTDAGTFSCFKISYDIETKSVITLRASAVEWIAKDIGVVRSESFNKKGKLTGYSELTKLEN